MPSTVYFVPYHLKNDRKGLLARIRAACLYAGIADTVSSGDLTALKMHFGEAGLVSYLRPAYPRAMVDLLTEIGAKPFLTDTNTLYRVARHNAVDHLFTANRNGFGLASVGAPIIIADGLHGHAYQDYAFEGGRHFENVPIPDAIHDADSLVVLSHFTAHLAASFGACIKNLSMGCSNPQGKRRMHCHAKPSVDPEQCTACGTCTEWCPTGAITVEDHAVVDEELCMACGECTVVCPMEAIRIPWDENSSILQEKMAEYALAVTKQKANKVFLVSGLIDITPHCDCMEHSETPFRPNLGFLVGRDPVAIDQIGVDFINGKLVWDGNDVLPGTEIGDPLREIYPQIDWNAQLKHGELIGLGSRDYDLQVLRGG